MWQGNMHHVQPVGEEYAEEIYAMVNDAYAVEIGNTGVAFKTTDRFVSLDECRETLQTMTAFGAFTADKDQDQGSQRLVGVIFCGPNQEAGIEGENAGTYGPFAVLPSMRGLRIGSVLMDAAEKYLREECHYDSVCITVIDVRTDLIPMYEAKGYVIRRTYGTFPHPDRLSGRKIVVHTYAKDL